MGMSWQGVRGIMRLVDEYVLEDMQLVMLEPLGSLELKNVLHPRLDIQAYMEKQII
jgi:hypothetical protein